MSGALAYKDEYDAYELINGEVYMMARPSYKHMRVEGNIFGLFDSYLKGKKCKAIFEMDVHLSEKDQFIPDVAIVCNPDIVKEDGIHGAPDLVVEVLSPSTAMKDRTVKLATYAKHGVKEYWLVDPRGKTIEVYHLKEGAYELAGVYFFYTEEQWSDMNEERRALAEEQKAIKVSLYDDFIIDVAEVFRDVN